MVGRIADVDAAGALRARVARDDAVAMEETEHVLYDDSDSELEGELSEQAQHEEDEEDDGPRWDHR